MAYPNVADRSTRWKEEFGLRDPFSIRNIVECTEFAEMDSRFRGNDVVSAGALIPVGYVIPEEVVVPVKAGIHRLISKRFEFRNSSLDPSLRSLSLAAAVLIVTMCAVSACTLPSLRDLAQSAGRAATTAMKPSEIASEDPLLVFLAEAEEGEVRDLDDAATGTSLRVAAGRTYHAASGRVCRRFSVSSAATPDANEEGLVCRDAAGRWTRAGLLAPVSP